MIRWTRNALAADGLRHRRGWYGSRRRARLTMEFPDLPNLVARGAFEGCAGRARQTPGGGGHRDQGFSISAWTCRCNALTKYPSGGGDVLMGSVTTRDAALHLALNACHMRMGLGRGRERCGDRAGARLGVAALALRPRTTVPRASWRALVGTAPGGRAGAASGAAGFSRPRALGRAVHGRAAGLFSVVFDARYSMAQVDAFVDALKLFKIGYSWARAGEPGPCPTTSR